MSQRTRRPSASSSPVGFGAPSPPLGSSPSPSPYHTDVAPTAWDRVYEPFGSPGVSTQPEGSAAGVVCPPPAAVPPFSTPPAPDDLVGQKMCAPPSPSLSANKPSFADIVLKGTKGTAPVSSSAAPPKSEAGIHLSNGPAEGGKRKKGGGGKRNDATGSPKIKARGSEGSRSGGGGGRVSRDRENISPHSGGPENGLTSAGARGKDGGGRSASRGAGRGDARARLTRTGSNASPPAKRTQGKPGTFSTPDLTPNNLKAANNSELSKNSPAKKLLNIHNNNLLSSKKESFSPPPPPSPLPHQATTIKRPEDQPPCNQTKGSVKEASYCQSQRREGSFVGPAHGSEGATKATGSKAGTIFTRRPGGNRRRRENDHTSYAMEMLILLVSHLRRWLRMALVALSWLATLTMDVLTMSSKLLLQLYSETSAAPSTEGGNISLPSTGGEAMIRLLACQGKDPYSILGVAPSCTDDEIKRYYRKQAVLVHPDKNKQPGAEEAFKILAHAFDLIGEPEKRADYDSKRLEQTQFWDEFNDLLTSFRAKMEEAVNALRWVHVKHSAPLQRDLGCTNCNKHHMRYETDRKTFAARWCSQCKIMHSAKDEEKGPRGTLAARELRTEEKRPGHPNSSGHRHCCSHYYSAMGRVLAAANSWRGLALGKVPKAEIGGARVATFPSKVIISALRADAEWEEFLSQLYGTVGGTVGGRSGASAGPRSGPGSTPTPPVGKPSGRGGAKGRGTAGSGGGGPRRRK
ncbi:unnamed protein product [Cyprideis torosa]|uniref:Uncharacterized protein n=1 Tax=Cyprideis torosa TaxID=163714 RepID=A0A7R8W0K3_9CRUS|nr:unnamed protein product [Cyprideis torosa]CAG0879856.1 unnamed protein product [Cyprideis torosa]